MTRIAVVTGGNKGIGFCIVKQLCQKFNGIVYLTARNTNLGQAAVTELEKLGLKPHFHQLDVSDDDSVNVFKEYLSKTYNRLDILINNAAIAFKMDATDPFGIQAEETLKINYFGLKKVCNALYPLLKPHARVVHLSSGAGHLSKIPGASLRAKLSDPDLTEEDLDKLMNDFISSAKAGTHVEAGWPQSAYSVSKVGVSTLTRIHQKLFDKDAREDLVVNSVHPGFVDTDMTSHGRSSAFSRYRASMMTPDRGAQAPVYLALLPPNTDIKGKYIWSDNTVVDWLAESTPPL
ncbi:carbonyl reductase [NADPH] 1 [Cephus cinctus]|uniref:carbonyl reductase (NADPH) n=1 Tax=Cephus cinctus TaxID=211228 RepID=A0AAJ7BPZ1_CEPCN|nr:carbonyl reductase [NADPH] 1 [Cephus cinctus]